MMKWASTLSRIARSACIVTIAGAFGLGCGAMGTLWILNLCIGPFGRDSWGSAPSIVLVMAIVGILMATAAVVASVAWTMRADFRGLDLYEWYGVVLGSLVGPALYMWTLQNLYPVIRLLIVAIIFPMPIIAGQYLMGLVSQKLKSLRG